jgi:hypothetical protein
VRERVEGVKKKLASVGDAAHWRVGSTSLIDSSICQLRPAVIDDDDQFDVNRSTQLEYR